jgi:septal ring factor EnvC (AmiA/AmiB activator)
MELVQAEVARQERILSFQRDSGGDPKLFACRVLERARCDALVAIRNARPLSDEKERLQIVKTGMDTEYELLTKNEGTLEQYAEVIARIEKENEVNQEWLSQQKAELERLAMREIERDIPAVEFNYGMSR